MYDFDQSDLLTKDEVCTSMTRRCLGRGRKKGGNWNKAGNERAVLPREGARDVFSTAVGIWVKREKTRNR